MKHIVAAVGDTHIASACGLFPPSFDLQANGHTKRLRPSAIQRHSYTAWCDFWERVEQKASTIDGSVIGIFDGDIVDCNKKNPLAIATNYHPQIVSMAVEVLQPAMNVITHAFIVRGSKIHVGLNGALEETLAMTLHAKYPSKVVKNTEANSFSWQRCLIRVGSLLIDAAHHPRAKAYLPYTLTQVAARESTIVANTCIQSCTPIPDIVIRAHLHYPGDSGKRHKPYVIYLPSWTGVPDDYVNQLGNYEVRPLGGVILEIEGGDFTCEFVEYKPRRQKVWELK